MEKLEDIVPCRVETIVMKHVGMQVIEHCRATCDWSNKQKITGHRTKLKQELSIN